MRKSVNNLLSLFVIFVSVFLSSCSSPTRFPKDAERALESYWESLPTDPALAYQILQVWPGVVPVETTTPWAPKMEVWCAETEITAAEDSSIIGETVIWIVMRNDKMSDWSVAMLATMSSIWPYEACGKGQQ